MPRNETKRKHRTDLSSNQGKEVGLSVVHSQNVQAERKDPRRLLQALDGVGQEFQKKAAQKKTEADEATIQRAIRDRELDEVDEDLFEGNELYRQTSNGVLGKTAGLKFLNETHQDMQRQLETDPDFDFDEFFQERKQQVYEGVDDPDVLKGINQSVLQAESQLRATYEANRARLEVEQGVDNLSQYAFEAFQGGNVRSTEDLKALIDTGRDLGLDSDEIDDAMGNQALIAIQQGNLDLYELLKNPQPNRAPGLSMDAKWGPLLKNAHDAGVLKKQQEEARTEKIAAIDKYRAEADFDSRMAAGEWNEGLGQTLVQEGLMSPDKLASKRRQFFKEQEDARDKLTAEAGAINALNQGYSGVEAFLDAGGKESDLQKTFDGLVSTARNALIEAEKSEDPDALQAARNQMAASLDLGRRAGFFSSGMSYLFNTVVPSTPAEFVKVAERFTYYENQGYGDYILSNLGNEAEARFRAYTAMTTRVGLDPEAAAERIQNSEMTYQEASRELEKIAWKDLNKITDSLARDGRNSSNLGDIRRQLSSIAATYVMLGYTPDDALELAKEHHEARYANVGGVNLRVGSEITADFPGKFDDYVEDSLKPALKESGLDLDDLDISPMPVKGMPGSFYLVPEGFAAPLFNNDGQAWIVNETLLDKAGATRALEKQEQEASLKALEARFLKEAPDEVKLAATFRRSKLNNNRNYHAFIKEWLDNNESQ